MKTSRFSEQQIAVILKEPEDGTTVDEICLQGGHLDPDVHPWTIGQAKRMIRTIKEAIVIRNFVPYG